MKTGLDLLMVLVALTHLRLLASIRLGACGGVIAMQGMLLGAMPLLMQTHTTPVQLLGLALGSMILKGVVFPWLWFRALREMDVSREVEPVVGYLPSLLLGLAALGGSVWLGRHLVLPGPVTSDLVLPVAFFSVMAGFLLMIGRPGVMPQVLGFLVMENGVFTFGVGASETVSLPVELGFLLDALVVVLAMGILVFHGKWGGSRPESDRLSSLRD